MKTYFYRGEYTEPKWHKLLVSSKDGRKDIKKSIDRFGGNLVSSFLLSPIGFVQFPNDTRASEWVQSISKQTGVQSFEIFHASNAGEIEVHL